MSKSFKKVAIPVAAAIVGNLIAPGIGTALGSTLSAGTLGSIGAAVGSGAGTYSQTHSIPASLLSAGGSYVGGQVGGSLAGGTGGTVGGALNTALGSEVGGAILPSLGGNILGANLGSTLGSIAGSYAGGNLAQSLLPTGAGNVDMGNGVTPYRPTREAANKTPASFQSFGSLTPEQMTSNIATGGVYGGGSGADESDFFQNMINRRLVDDTGKVDSDFSEINPIENSYLSQLGLGGYGNPTDLLEALSKRKKAA